MTKLDLLCEEPYKIGLLGTISFLSFSIGSVLIMNLADSRGRKTTVLYSGLVTPVCILLLQQVGIDIKIIYVLIFIMGLTYNPRSSTAYLYSSEFMETRNRIRIGTYIFGFSGIF